jgi:hypothetical protein
MVERARDGAALAQASPVADGSDRRCVRCGAPLGQRWWIIVFPDGAHEECVDWSARPFPFTRELDVLRLLARRLGDGRPRDVVEGLRRDLDGLARRWPVIDDPLDVLRAARSILRAARPCVATLDHRDRQRL